MADRAVPKTSHPNSEATELITSAGIPRGAASTSGEESAHPESTSAAPAVPRTGDVSSTSAPSSHELMSTPPLLSSDERAETNAGDTGGRRAASPPRATAATSTSKLGAPPPSPPRPPRFSDPHHCVPEMSGTADAGVTRGGQARRDSSAGHAQNHAGANATDVTRTAQTRGGQAVLSEAPQKLAPLHLATTVRCRQTEEEARRTPSDRAELSFAHATAPESPLGIFTVTLDDRAASTPSASAATLLSPSPKTKLTAAWRAAGDRPHTPGSDLGSESGASATNRGGSKHFYAEEAEDFAAQYKNAGLTPPDLDELEDEVLLGRSLSPALLIAKQKELSQNTSSVENTPQHGHFTFPTGSHAHAQSQPSSSSEAPPIAHMMVDHHRAGAPFTVNTVPRFASHTTVTSGVTSGSASMYDVPAAATVAEAYKSGVGQRPSQPPSSSSQLRTLAAMSTAHAAHYPHQHAMPMAVFVSNSAGASTRHGSAPHGLSASTSRQHAPSGASMGAALARGASATSAGGVSANDGDHAADRTSKRGHRHTRRRHHHRRHASDEVGGDSGSEAMDTNTAGDADNARTHRRHHHRHRNSRGRSVNGDRTHPASATLPVARCGFPSHKDRRDTTMTRAGTDLAGTAPESPILPDPPKRYAQSALQPNERAPHFPHHFGYLSTLDEVDDDVTNPTQGSSPVGTGSETTTNPRTSSSPTPGCSSTSRTGATHAPSQARAERDVVYSLVPSTRTSTRMTSPAPEMYTGDGRRQLAPGPTESVVDDHTGAPTLGAGHGARAGWQGEVTSGVGALPRARTAPDLAQEESQRQLQEALQALGLCMRPTSTPQPAQTPLVGHHVVHDPPSSPTADCRVARAAHVSVHPLAPLSDSTTSSSHTASTQLTGPASAGFDTRTAFSTIPEGTLSTPVAPQSPQMAFPRPVDASNASRITLRNLSQSQSVPFAEPGLSPAAKGTRMEVSMAHFEPQALAVLPFGSRRSRTVPSMNALLVPAGGASATQTDLTTTAAGTDSFGAMARRGSAFSATQANSFSQSMSFNPVRNASFLLNASFGQLANFAFVKDGNASNSRLTQQNREALVKELERRRARLVKQLAQQQKEATMGNVFALVRGSNAWQLQYLLQEGLVDVNERDYNSCTPLHVAALEGNQAIARLLLSFDADVLAVDRFGRTPLDCAAVNRHGSVGRYLLAVIRNKQQQQQQQEQGRADGLASVLETGSMAFAAAAEGEDSVSHTPFGLSAPVMSPPDVLASSPSHSTAPVTNASTMPDHGESLGGLQAASSSSIADAHQPSGRGTGLWQAEVDGAPRLLVPGEELVGRKQEKVIRNRARLESASGVAESLITNEGSHSSGAVVATNTSTPGPARSVAIAGADHAGEPTRFDTEVDTPRARETMRGPNSMSSYSAPNTPWASVGTAQPGTPLPGTASSSIPSTTATRRAKTAHRLTESVSRGRSRYAKSSHQSALFAAEEDKFLEEQEEEIAEEVALSAAGPMGSPTFFRGSAALRTHKGKPHPPSSSDSAVPVSHVATAPTASGGADASEASVTATATVDSVQADAPASAASGAVTTEAHERGAEAVTAQGRASAEGGPSIETGAVQATKDEDARANADAAAEATRDDGSAAPRFSIFTTISDTVSLIVCMCGLPGRGKSFISKRLVRYINWKGVPCRVFNAGNYRRQLLGVAGTADAAFFDPNNPKGKELRERMAELACEDLVRFIGSHVLAVGILDATNTTKARRSRLKHFFENECQKHGLAYRLLFIESVCTDETIITENILRSKCDNDDFKDVQDTTEVIAEFRDRIHQYEKVYETLEPSEDVPFIKIINVKHHVIIHKVESGLGSRIAFFLQNLHPVAYPIYIVVAGETYGDQQGVFGGDERLTERGEEFAVALRQFIQDRYVPNMVVLHATNPSVLYTIRPLIEGSGGGSAHAHGSSHTNNIPCGNVSAGSPTVMSSTTRSGSALVEPAAVKGTTPISKPVSPVVRTSPTTSLHGSRRSHQSSPASAGGRRYVFPTELPPQKLHKPATTPEALVRLAGGDLRVVAAHTAESSSSSSAYSSSSSSAAEEAAVDGPSQRDWSSSAYSDESTSASGCCSGSSDEEEDAEEVLCPVPGLDNINFGRFSGHSAAWVRDKYPRLSALLYVSAMEEEAKNALSSQGTHGASPTTAATSAVSAQSASPTKRFAGGGPTAVAAASGLHIASPTVAPPCSAKLKEGGLAWFRHAPSHMDPILAYCVQFPNGESCRQVNARLEPALMAVMRTQSPVFVIAPAVPAQGMLAFFADVIPELSPTLRIPRHCVIELGVKDDVTVHALLPGAGIPCAASQGSPLMDHDEIQEAIKIATDLAATMKEAKA